MKFHIPSLLIGLSLFTVGASAQTNAADSIQKANKVKAAEQAAKADVYIVKKSVGTGISEGIDSVAVQESKTVKKNTTRKTRKVSCDRPSHEKKID